MRRLAATLCLTICALLCVAPESFSQPPGQQPRQPGGGFRFPAPPFLDAIDKDNNGEVSAEELSTAPAALKTLDKNKDGSLDGNELRPNFGGGRQPGGRQPGGRQPRGNSGTPAAPTEAISPEQVKPLDGAAELPDHAAYQKLSYKGKEVMIDTFLADLEFVKFTINNAHTDKPQIYFINTNTHRAHMMFGRAVGLPRAGQEQQMKGVLVFRPMLKSPSGKNGLYTFEFEPWDAYSHDKVKLAHTMLVSKMPALKGNLGYYPRGPALPKVEEEQELYKNSIVKVYRDEDLTNADVAYMPLNTGETFGRLRLMEQNERPGSRDIVLYQSLPNEMPRVAGIITSVRQTPLSHVNLRAIQDQVPNAFIANAANDPKIKPLIGKNVAYKVTADGYELREAKTEELDAHFAALRPKQDQVPKRNLQVKKVRPLSAVKFTDSDSVGVKAANLATMLTFGFPEGTVPEGAAIPFYFYDEFMKHNGLYDAAKEMLVNEEFTTSREEREKALQEFRSKIKQSEMPEALAAELDKLHKSFDKGTSLRCRSSTNNEDLPGFSGAGLYESYTHKPSEGHLSKSIKQVYASLWTFRAFEEREFYRVDHLQTAMGVLVHPNYKGETVNGVAVTDDILYQTEGHYYVNSQVGENLVTNPDQESVPEEVLLDWYEASKDQTMRTSNQATDGKPLLSPEHTDQLRKHMGRIHARFAKFYGKDLEDETFAMEIEFKITKDGQLAIKQARPWVYGKPGATQPHDPKVAGGTGSFPGGGRGPGGPGGGRGGFSFAMLDALDPDKDRKISSKEIESSIENLKKLDKNEDGNLSAEELGWPPTFGGAGPRN